MAEDAPIRVEIAWADSDGVRLASISMPQGSRLGDTLVRATLLGMLPAERARIATEAVAVHGRLRKPDHVLHDGDRIDLPGPLRVDPKVARARRAASRARGRA